MNDGGPHEGFVQFRSSVVEIEKCVAARSFHETKINITNIEPGVLAVRIGLDHHLPQGIDDHRLAKEINAVGVEIASVLTRFMPD
jgi:hypothetical protein